MAGRLDLVEVVGSLAGFDVSSLSDDEIKGFVVDAQVLVNAAQALAAVALEELDRRGVWADDGALSAAGWAAPRTGTGRRELRAQARAGRVLRVLGSAAGPARRGRLSADHLGVLASCERRHAARAARDEALLVARAVELDAEGFRAAARHWCDLAEAQDSPDPEPGPAPASHVHLSRTLDGWWALDGLLAPDDGALVHAALEAGVDRRLRALRDGDPSVSPVASELRADALVDLAGQAMRGEPSEESVPDRYRVGVVVGLGDVERLGVAGCDSALYRIVVGARGEVLDVGTATRRWPTGIRRAVTYRDGGCVFPGCDRPPSWCDVHHCRHWEDGGPTSVDNGALLCRSHHSFIHKRRWSMTVEDGHPVTRRPDGTEHTITRWHSPPPAPAASGPPGRRAT